MSGNAEQESMKVICGSYFVADREGPLVFLWGRHVHNLSLALSWLSTNILNLECIQVSQRELERSGEQPGDPFTSKLNIS